MEEKAVKVKFREWFSALGIRQKVQYTFIAAISISLIFCFVFFYFFMRNRVTVSVTEKSISNLSSIEQNFEAVINNVNNISKLLMVNDVVLTYLKTDSLNPIYAGSARSEIYGMLNSFSGHYSVFVFRNDTQYTYTGIGIISAHKSVIYSDKWYGNACKHDGQYIIVPNFDEAFTFNTDTNIISFVRIIYDINTQRKIGMLVINIPISELEKTYMNLADENNHFAYLDSDGNIICSDAGFNNDNIDDNLNHRSIIGEQAVTGKIVTDSGIVIAAQSTVRIMEGVSFEFLFGILGILAITIIMMMLVNIFIHRYITHPISKLSASMQQVEKGTLRRVSFHSNNDEIGRLKDRYNQMLIQINKLIEELIEQEQSRQKAEIDILHEQIKPHFLYNTLNTIGYMSLQNSPEEVYDAIETLGSFYRKFLSKGSQTITLDDEISIVKNYIKLQRLRYDDMFEDEYDIQEGLGSVMVLKLILQPLVENSIYHGIRLKGEKGIIRIRAFSQEKMLHIVVYDSGVGMSPEQVKRLLRGEDRKSFGFKGTIDRIRRFYNVDDVVSIRSSEGEYCEIELTIPIK
jgi:two-component system sensor histidine kinase YesM